MVLILRGCQNSESHQVSNRHTSEWAYHIIRHEHEILQYY